MTQYAEARIVEPVEPAELSVEKRIARTARAVANGHDGELTRALESVSWERRGPLGLLTRRSRPVRIPGGGG